VLRPAIPSQAPSSAAWVALPLALRRRRATDDSPSRLTGQGWSRLHRLWRQRKTPAFDRG
jgi:hypothetical protein